MTDIPHLNMRQSMRGISSGQSRGILCRLLASVSCYEFAHRYVHLPHWKQQLPAFSDTSAQVHVSLGHSTVMAEVMYFGTPDGSGHEPAAALHSVLNRLGQLALKVSSISN